MMRCYLAGALVLVALGCGRTEPEVGPSPEPAPVTGPEADAKRETVVLAVPGMT